MSAYPGGEQLALPIPTAHEANPLSKLAALYGVSVYIYEDRHACTSLNHLDGRTHRLVSESHGCYEVTSVTRRAALTALQAAVTQALLDLDQDTA